MSDSHQWPRNGKTAWHSEDPSELPDNQHVEARLLPSTTFAEASREDTLVGKIGSLVEKLKTLKSEADAYPLMELIGYYTVAPGTVIFLSHNGEPIPYTYERPSWLEKRLLNAVSTPIYAGSLENTWTSERFPKEDGVVRVPDGTAYIIANGDLKAELYDDSIVINTICAPGGLSLAGCDNIRAPIYVLVNGKLSGYATDGLEVVEQSSPLTERTPASLHQQIREEGRKLVEELGALCSNRPYDKNCSTTVPEPIPVSLLKRDWQR